VEIKFDDISSSEVTALLDEHLKKLLLSLHLVVCVYWNSAALRIPEITFWSVCEDSLLIGCGAVKPLNQYYAEKREKNNNIPIRSR